MKPVWLLAAACSAAVAAHAAVDKPYQMFTGTDIDLALDGRLCRVEGVKGSSFLVTENGRLTAVPMTKAGALRVVPSLKVVHTLVHMDNLVTERAYTKAADPRRQFLSQVEAMVAQEDNVEIQEEIEANTAVNGIAALSPTAGAGGRPGAAGPGGAANAAAIQAATLNAHMQTVNAENMLGNDLNQFGTEAGKIQQQLEEALYDAMHIVFKVSCDRVLTDPYLVATVHYHDPGKQPGPAHWWIFAEHLDVIQPQPHKVDILAGGLPPGFTYDRRQIHLYDHGTEVATSVSTNLIALSEDDVFQYLIANYMGEHREATLPPAPVLRLPTRGESATLMRAGAPRYVFVSVDKDGVATGVFTDAQCTSPLAEGLATLTLLRVRFTPALQDGKPTPGVARLDLN